MKTQEEIRMCIICGENPKIYKRDSEWARAKDRKTKAAIKFSKAIKEFQLASSIYSKVLREYYEEE